MTQRMAQAELPHGHQIGNRWCTACYVTIRETLLPSSACDGLMHRNGNEEICDKCGTRHVSSPID